MLLKMNLTMRLIRLVVIVAVVFYALVPLLFWAVPSVMQHVFFLNFVRVPFTDLNNLARHGVRSMGRNFYIDSADSSTKGGRSGGKGPRLGVWHVLPASVSKRLLEEGRGPSDEAAISDAEMEKSLNEGPQAVMIYLHGNSFDRTTTHRCELYNVLSEMDFHVLAMDYRGYGDSTGHPDEAGVAEDAHAIYNYARRIAPDKPIYVWGHSMGTGVAVRAVAEMSDADHPPDALILESPFNNLRDVINNHPFSWPWRHLPFFDEVIVNSLIRSGLVMNSEQRIGRVKCPILVLHSKDDHIIPVELARKLVAKARQVTGRTVSYTEFDASRRFLHKFIHRAEELPRIVEDFLLNSHLSERSRNRMDSAAERAEGGEHLWERREEL